MIDFLINWGYLGLFISAVLAGSVLPFSSEIVLATLIVPSVGLSPWGCLAIATVGNVIGGMTCYYLGNLGKISWIEQYLRISEKNVRRTMRYLHNKSAWMAFFAFLPIVGSVITVSLGYMRSNPYIVCMSMTLGKIVRYLIVVLVTMGLLHL